MGRIFFLASHYCVGESGGGHGVEYRLHMADKKYHLFENEVFYIFGDRVIVGDSEPGAFLEQKDMPKQSGMRVRIKRYIPSVFRVIKMEKRFKQLGQYLESLDRQFHFGEDDIYICHDFRIAYVFLKKYYFPKVAVVHHMQGSIYFEWHSETGLDSGIMRKYFNFIFKSNIQRAKYVCFPSKGTEESLINSEPSLKEAVNGTVRRYLYNGVSCPDVSKEKLPDWIKEIDEYEGYKFATVANLNAAKAIERIPEYLYHLKKAGIQFKWVLVGNGVQAEAVREKIGEYDLSDSVIWKQENVPHADLMKLFSVTNFYILFHRYSIFDLSTLEAMHYGNIPILTPVGGNKEVIIDGNGLFVSDFSNIDSFMELLEKGELEKLKEKNIKIQTEKFDDRAFLQRYADLCKNF